MTDQYEIDLMKIQNYLDSKILAPMNVQEQKALCRIILCLAQNTPRT